MQLSSALSATKHYGIFVKKNDQIVNLVKEKYRRMQ